LKLDLNVSEVKIIVQKGSTIEPHSIVLLTDRQTDSQPARLIDKTHLCPVYQSGFTVLKELGKIKGIILIMSTDREYVKL